MYNDHTPGRVCACFIEGVTYPDGALNPLWPCLMCSITDSNIQWTNVPDDTICDPKAQLGWNALPGQFCQYNYHCDTAVCVGLPYACPPIQVCEAPLEAFPYSCDMLGPADPQTAGCQRLTKPAGLMCKRGVNQCAPPVYCNGIVGTCGTQIRMAGIIYEEQDKAFNLVLPNKWPVDTQIAVYPSLDTISMHFVDSYVQCDALRLHMAVIPAGTCDVARVTQELGQGWGSEFLLPETGYVALRVAPVSLLYLNGTVGLATDHEVVEWLAPPYTTPVDKLDLSASVNEQCGCIPGALLVAEVSRFAVDDIAIVTLVDVHWRTLNVTLSPVRAMGVWVQVVGSVVQNRSTVFDWTQLMGFRVWRSGSKVLPGVGVGTLVARMRRIQLGINAPRSCTRLTMRQSATPAATAVASGVSSVRVLVDAPGAGLRDVWDEVLLYFPTVVFSFELWVPLRSAVGAPTRVVFTGVNGTFSVLLDPVAGPMSGAWRKLQAPLRFAVFTGRDNTKTVENITIMDFVWDSTVPQTTVLIRNAVVEQISYLCAPYMSAHTYSSVPILSAMTLVFSATSLNVVAAGSASPMTILPVDVSEYYNSTCDCWPNVFLEVNATFNSEATVIDTVKLLDSAGYGLAVPLTVPRDTVSYGVPVVVRFPVLRSHMVKNGASTPDWASIVRVGVTRTGTAGASATFGSNIVLRSLSLRRFDVPCVKSTTPELFDASPSRVLLAGAPSTVAVAPGDVTGKLVDPSSLPLPFSIWQSQVSAFSASALASFVPSAVAVAARSGSSGDVAVSVGGVSTSAGVVVSAMGAALGDDLWSFSVSSATGTVAWRPAEGVAASVDGTSCFVVGSVYGSGTSGVVGASGGTVSAGATGGGLDGLLFAVTTATGAVTYADCTGGSSDEQFHGVAASRNVLVVAGETCSTRCAASLWAFQISYSALGSALAAPWPLEASGDGTSSFVAVSIDMLSSVSFAAGPVSGSVVFGGASVSSGTATGVVIVAVDSAGNVIWTDTAVPLGSGSISVTRGAVAAMDGLVALGLTVRDSVMLGGAVVWRHNQTTSDAILIALNASSGTVVWVRGVSGNVNCTGVTATHGRLVGSFASSGDAVVDTQLHQVMDPAGLEAFVVGWSSSGVAAFAEIVGGPGASVAIVGVGGARDGRVAFAGWYSNSTSVGFGVPPSSSVVAPRSLAAFTGTLAGTPVDARAAVSLVRREGGIGADTVSAVCVTAGGVVLAGQTVPFGVLHGSLLSSTAKSFVSVSQTPGDVAVALYVSSNVVIADVVAAWNGTVFYVAGGIVGSSTSASVFGGSVSIASGAVGMEERLLAAIDGSSLSWAVASGVAARADRITSLAASDVYVVAGGDSWLSGTVTYGVVSIHTPRSGSTIGSITLGGDSSTELHVSGVGVFGSMIVVGGYFTGNVRVPSSGGATVQLDSAYSTWCVSSCTAYAGYIAAYSAVSPFALLWREVINDPSGASHGSVIMASLRLSSNVIAAAGYTTAHSISGGSVQSGYGSTSEHGWAASFDMSGGVNWVRTISGGDGSSSHVQSLLVASGVVWVGGWFQGALAACDGDFTQSATGDASQSFVVAYDGVTSRMLSVDAFGAEPSAANPVPAMTMDTVSALAFDAVGGRILAAGSTTGTFTVGTLVGNTGTAGNMSSDSDIVVVARDAHVSGVAPSASSFVVSALGDGHGLGFVSGVSVGASSVVVAGFFNGDMFFVDSGTYLTGVSTRETGVYDGFVGIYDRASGKLAYSAQSAEYVLSVSNTAANNDRFVDAATSTDGSVHFILGYTTNSAGATDTFAGVSFTTHGNVDSLLVAINDGTRACSQITNVGWTSGNDKSLALAVSKQLVVVVGSSTGVASAGGVNIFAGAIGSRTIGTMFVLDLSGNIQWGLGFGTSTSTGKAVVRCVAIDYDGTYIAIGGSFVGGDLPVGGFTLTNNLQSSAKSHVAFVALVRVATKSVVWATAATTLSIGYSTLRDIAIFDGVIVACGEFSTTALQFTHGVSHASPRASGNTTFSSAFVLGLDIATGYELWGIVPVFSVNTAAMSVARVDDVAFVAFDVFGSGEFVDAANVSRAVGDPTAPAQHRAAVLGLAANAGTMVAFELFGDEGSNHVSPRVVRASFDASAVVVGGWRTGNVGPLVGRGISLAYGLGGFEATTPGQSYIGVMQMPFVVGINVRLVDPSLTSRVQVLRSVHRASTGTGSNVQSVVVAGRSSIMVAVFTAAGSIVGSSSSTNVLSVFERATGVLRWSAGVGPANGARSSWDTRVVVAAASVDGSSLCVAGTVKVFGTAATTILDTSVTPLSAANGFDLFVACFLDKQVTSGPVWLKVAGAVATGDAVFDGAIVGGSFWIAGSTKSTFVVNGASYGSNTGVAMCVVWHHYVASGATKVVLTFGNGGANTACSAYSVAASTDGLFVWVGGSYAGGSLAFGGSAGTLSAGVKEQGFVARYSLAVAAFDYARATTHSSTPSSALGSRIVRIVLSGTMAFLAAQYSATDVNFGALSVKHYVVTSQNGACAIFGVSSASGTPSPAFAAGIETDGNLVAGCRNIVASSSQHSIVAAVEAHGAVRVGMTAVSPVLAAPSTAAFTALLTLSSVNGSLLTSEYVIGLYPQFLSATGPDGSISTALSGYTTSQASASATTGSVRAASGETTVVVAGLAPMSVNPTYGQLVTLTSDIQSLIDPKCNCTAGYVMAFDVMLDDALCPLAGGRWESAADGGFGVFFNVSSRSQNRAGTWIHLTSDVLELSDAYGNLSSTESFDDMSRLTFVMDPKCPPRGFPTRTFQVRDVRFFRPDPRCISCGSAQVSPPATVLHGSQAMLPRAAFAVDMYGSTGGLAPFPLDVSLAADPTCNCLIGANVEFDLLGDESALRAILAVAVMDSDARNGLTVAFNASFATKTGAQSWHVVMPVAATDHVAMDDGIDWRFVGRVDFLSTGGYNGSFTVREFKIMRPCIPTNAIFHPWPNTPGTSVTLKRTKLNLVPGAHLRVITYETNVWGDASTPTCSIDFYADATPPIATQVTALDVLPSPALVNVDVSFSKYDLLKVGWLDRFFEEESAPDQLLEFYVGNVTFLHNGSQVPGEIHSTHHRFATVSAGVGYVNTTKGFPYLADGVVYVPHLYVNNRGGLLTIVRTNGVWIDASPPTPHAGLRDANASHLDFDLDYTTASSVVASWDGWDEPHSYTKEVLIGVGTTTGGPDAYAYVVVGNATREYVFSGPFTEGVKYYVLWFVTNGADAYAVYHTDGFIMDTSPPLVESIEDIFPLDDPAFPSYYTDANTLGDMGVHDGQSVFRAKFNCSDPESIDQGKGYAEYKWRLCGDAGCSADLIVVDWMDTGRTHYGTTPIRIEHLNVNKTRVTHFFVQVWCFNPAGLSSYGMSDGVEVLWSGGTPSNATAVVSDVDLDASAGGSIADVMYHHYPSIAAAWQGFQVVDSPILFYRFGVGTLPFAHDISAFASVGLASTAHTDAAVSNLLVDGTTYYSTVQAVALTGSYSMATSNGVVNDRSPPIGGVTTDVWPVGVDLCPGLSCLLVRSNTSEQAYTAQTSALAAVLTGVHDPHTGVGGISWGISACASPGTFNVMPLEVVDSNSRRFLKAAGLALVDKVRYCVTVIAQNYGRAAASFESSGVLVDLTPPTISFVHEGDAVFDKDVVGTSDRVLLAYVCIDLESGIDHYEARLLHVQRDGRVVNETDFMWLATGATSGAAFGGLSLVHRENYAVRLRCVNGAGVYVEMNSDGFLCDLTPASAEKAVVQQSIRDVVVNYQTDVMTINASWTGFYDVESYIVEYRYSIGTVSGGSNVVSMVSVGAATFAIARGLHLVDGVTYYVTVYAIGVGGTIASSVSSGVTVDSTAPVPGHVVALKQNADSALNYIASRSTFTAVWNDTVDPHSRIDFLLGLGTVEHGAEVVPYFSVGSNVSFTFTGLQLHTGATYFVTIVAVAGNGVGRQTVVSSAIVVDPYKPILGTVYDGPDPAASSIAFFGLDTLRCSWRGFVDDVSGLQFLRVAFGTTTGAADVVPWTVIGPGFDSHTVRGLSLVNGQTYFCGLQAVDYAGNTVTGWSDGAKADVTPPVAGALMDGKDDHSDATFQYDRTALAARWQDWVDHESTIVAWSISAGTSPGAMDIFGWQSVPVYQRRASKTLPTAHPLSLNTWYYVNLRALNSIGLFTVRSTNGVFILPVPGPDAPVPASMLISSLAVGYVNARASADKSWCECEDPNAWFIPATGACSCAPGFVFATSTQTCVSCPANTCKAVPGNAASLCTSDCSVVNAASPARLNASTLTPCGPLPAVPGAVRMVADPANASLCVCPPGAAWDAALLACMRCGGAMFKGVVGNSDSLCDYCWRASQPDIVMDVLWTKRLLVANVSQFVVSVGLAPGALRWTRSVPFASDSTRVQFVSTDSLAVGPPFVLGTLLHVMVRAVDDVSGLVVAEDRLVAVVDYSPPLPGNVSDGTNPIAADWRLLPWNSRVAATWNSFNDTEAPAASLQYAVAFGTAPYATDLVQYVNVRNATAYATHVPVMAEGTVVYATVRCTNPTRGYSLAVSDGVTVQSALPPGTVVIRGDSLSDVIGATPYPHAHAPAQRNMSTVTTAWRFGDASLDQTLGYWWALRDASRGGAMITNWTWVVDATLAVATSLNIPQGHFIFAEVTAVNVMGVNRTAVSPFTLVQSMVPRTPVVTLTQWDAPFVARGSRVPYFADGSAGELYQSSTDTLSFTFTVRDDVAAPVSPSAKIVIGTLGSGGGTQALPITTIGASDYTAVPGVNNTYTHVVTGLTLLNNECYTVQVSGRNAALLWSAFGTSLPMCVDVTAPNVSVMVNFTDDAAAVAWSAAAGADADAVALARTVCPVARAAVRYVEGTTYEFMGTRDSNITISLVAVDAESGVSHVEVEWVLSPYNSRVEVVPLSEINFDGVSVRNFTRLLYRDLSPGWYAGVRISAFNSAGVLASATSGPVVLDATAPVFSSVRVAPYQSSTNAFAADWLADDMESPVVGYAYSMLLVVADVVSGRLPSATVNNTAIMLAWSSVATSMESNAVSLSHAAKYRFYVTACNILTLCATFTRDIVIDGALRARARVPCLTRHAQSRHRGVVWPTLGFRRPRRLPVSARLRAPASSPARCQRRQRWRLGTSSPRRSRGAGSVISSPASWATRCRWGQRRWVRSTVSSSTVAA